MPIPIQILISAYINIANRHLLVLNPSKLSKPVPQYLRGTSISVRSMRFSTVASQAHQFADILKTVNLLGAMPETQRLSPSYTQI
eukprot:1080837-Amphidinium_carterae.1